MFTEGVKRIRGNEDWNQFSDGFREGRNNKRLPEDSGRGGNVWRQTSFNRRRELITFEVAQNKRGLPWEAEPPPIRDISEIGG